MENVVLAGVDGSPESRGAALWAVREAGFRQWPVWFANVFPSPTIADPSIDSAYLQTAHRDAERLFQGLETEARRLGVSSQGIALPGRANEVLVKLSNDAGLTVVGRRHHSAIGARLGSVSSALAAHAHSPTAVIPHGWESRPSSQGMENGHALSVGRVVVAVEPGPGAMSLLHNAAGFAQRDGLSLSVVTVAATEHEETYGSSLTELLTHTKERFIGLEISVHYVAGKPVPEIAHAAGDAVLLVVGTRGFGGLSGWMHGSVSQALLQHISLPMLVVPNRAPE
jgi:nucleotide-binding universal stress UspA family protein